jgi:tRNA-(ms[2]io[6]A)-hydroxylase
MLGLLRATDPQWAETAVGALDVLLVDHAHCEMKAASNAMSLATRWPASPRVARALTDVAEEELRHFREVLSEIEVRGLTLGPPEPDAYAADLRSAAQKLSDKSPRGSLADRLLVGALIEARSCERFHLLAEALRARGEPLASFYAELFECEARHYTTLVGLAIDVLGNDRAARAKLDALAEIEAGIAASLGVRPTMHG